MTWTDQVDLSAVQRGVSAIAADPDLLKTAMEDPTDFLKTRCGVVPPIPLKLTRTSGGIFLSAVGEDAGSTQGYVIAYGDPLTEELTDDELDLVSAGGSSSGPFQMKLDY